MEIKDVVSSVKMFPLKGGHAATINGEKPRSLTVGETGFEVNGVRDRDYVLYDPIEEAFVTQRGWGAHGKKVKFPNDHRLATVQFDIHDDLSIVTTPVGEIVLPNDPQEGPNQIIQIFGKDFPAIEQGPEASALFTELLGHYVIMLRSDRENDRILPDRYQRPDAYNKVAGADGMPFLMTSIASLNAAHVANGMALGTVPIGRYRANYSIFGYGLGAFNEDYIDGQVKMTVGEVAMYSVKASSRCAVTDNDQETGERVGNGLKVLRHRAGEIFTGEKGVFFGENMVHCNVGTISEGDEVVIRAMSRQPNVNFRQL